MHFVRRRDILASSSLPENLCQGEEHCSLGEDASYVARPQPALATRCFIFVVRKGCQNQRRVKNAHVKKINVSRRHFRVKPEQRQIVCIEFKLLDAGLSNPSCQATVLFQNAVPESKECWSAACSTCCFNVCLVGKGAKINAG